MWYKFSIEEISYEPYEVSKLWAKFNNIGTRNTWYNTSKPKSLPKKPWDYYLDYEARGGDDAFFVPKPKYTYEQARAFAKKNRIMNHEQWVSFDLPEGMRQQVHKYPEYYKKGGAKNFFYQPMSHWSYNVAKKWANDNNILTTYQWLKTKKSPRLPSNPAEYYPDYYDRGGHEAFFGQAYSSPSKITATYDDVKNYIKTNNIKNYNNYLNLYKSNMLPNGFPANLNTYPEFYQRGGLDDLFENYIPKNRFNKSYEEAKNFARQNNIKSRYQWTTTRTSEYPVKPWSTYQDQYEGDSVFFNNVV